MPEFAVTRKKEKELLDKMIELEINENDLVENFVHSSGPGGQKTNKSSNCVQLKHRPTGVMVKVQKSRSQSVNRFLARRELVLRLEEEKLGRKSHKQIQVERIRKQKKRRKRRSGNKNNEEGL